MRSLHTQKFNEAQLPALVELSQQSLDRIPATACPLCDDWEKKLREANPHTPKNEVLVVTPAQFRRHVGAHMEQLALFAIPRGYKEDEDAGSSGAAPGVGTDDSSGKKSQADSRPDYEGRGNPPLHVAAFEGLEAKVLQLLEDGADINARGTTWGSAFAAAAAGGRGNIVELLLEKGVDVNAATFSDGGTALQAAAEGGHLEVVERLLEKGADVDAAAADVSGRTVLQAAAGGGHLEVVEWLLEKGADINAAAADDYGRTALQAAAGGGHLEVVERLLEKGADVNAAAAANRGRTALQAAAEGGRLEVVERLRKAGARDVNSR
jgi:ankyrin repeat protein